MFVGLPTWVEFFAIPMLPFERLHLSRFWVAVLFRTVDALFWIGVIFFVNRRVLRRFTLRIAPRMLLLPLAFGVVAIGKELFMAPYSGNSWITVVSGFFFAMSIGLNEETFSRALIFGFFEQYGMWVAAIISSVHFGLLHFSNYMWGGYSLGFNFTQILGAGAFGFFACGLMIYTGSIWIPILIHGLTDFPMMLMSKVSYTNQVTGSPDWLGTAAEAFFYVALGWALIYRSQQADMRRLRLIGIRFGLVEV